MLKSLTDFLCYKLCNVNESSWILGISVCFMVKVNIFQLLTVCVLQFIINDKTLHLLFSFTHWQCRNVSGHRHQISSSGDENCQIWHKCSIFFIIFIIVNWIFLIVNWYTPHSLFQYISEISSCIMVKDRKMWYYNQGNLLLTLHVWIPFSSFIL